MFEKGFCRTSALTEQGGHMRETTHRNLSVLMSYFAFQLSFYGQLGLLPASSQPTPFSPGCLGRHQRPSQLCYRDSFFRAPGTLAVPAKRKGPKHPSCAWWGLHDPGSSWCSFIFPSGADGGCRGKEREL